MDRRGHTTVTARGISADIVRSDFLKLQSIFRAELRALAGKDKLTLGMLNKILPKASKLYLKSMKMFSLLEMFHLKMLEERFL